LSEGKTDGDAHDHLFKIVTVGELGVGKSSIVLRYIEDTFVGEEVGSIGSDFKYAYITVEKLRLKLQIWDTAGQEKYRVMTSSYFGGASAFLVVFDLTNKASFSKVEKWIDEAKKLQDPAKPLSFFVFGNKSDLKDDRKCSKTDAEEIAKANNGTYFEVSAKTGDEIAKSFQQVGEQLYRANAGSSMRV